MTINQKTASRGRLSIWKKPLIQKRLPLVVLACLSGLVIFQAWAYYYRLPLWLGPRVILQPWLMQHGFMMYENIVDIHTPLMPLLVTMLRPLVPEGLNLAKLILIALLSLSTLLTFIVGRRKIGWLGGLWAACFFVVWSPTFSFNKLWHESFLTPLYLLLFLSYDTSIARRSAASCLWLGFIGGTAILFKQHAVLVFIAFVLWNTFTTWYLQRPTSKLLREPGLMFLGAILPGLVYVAYQYAQTGTLKGFLYWTVKYFMASNYLSQAAQPPTIGHVGVIASCCLLIPPAFICLVDAKRKRDSTWLQIGLGLLLIATSAIAIYPRFEYFHLQATLPQLAMVSALALAYVLRSGLSGRAFAISIAATLSAFWLITAGASYRPAFTAPAQQYVKEYSDLVPLAQEISQHVKPGERIYIFPDDESVADLYYLLRCSPPEFWTFHYPWYMLDWVRDRIIMALDTEAPPWIIYFPNRWNAENNGPEIMEYLQTHYRLKASFRWAAGEARLLQHR